MYDKLKALRELHLEILQEIAEIEKRSDEMSIETLADVAGIAKKRSELHDDLRKAFDKLIRSLSYRICYAYLQQGTGGPIRGQFFSVTPKTNTIPIPPKPDTEEYQQLLESVPPDWLRIHWPELRKHLNEAAEKGEKPQFKVPYTTECSVIAREKNV